MYPTLFETIKIEEGEIFNLQWHNRRFNKTQKEIFNRNQTIDLKQFISPPPKGLFRCKIIYAQEIISVNYYPYEPKIVQHFTVVESSLDYGYKYSDRTEIESLLNSHEEIIIEKEGLLTDTSIANIAFFDGTDWITPKSPLLAGTTRARLLKENFLRFGDIKKEDIKNYSNFALMNAMIGFRIQKSASIES